jgi:hypothetical protein
VSERTEKLLLGDWSRLVRDPIDLLRLTFLVAAFAFAVAGDPGEALRFLLVFAAVVVARFLDLPRLFDLGFVIGMAISVWGGPLGLFRALPWYDKVLHGTMSFFGAPLLYVLGVRFDLLPDLEHGPQRHRYLGIAVLSLALGSAIGAYQEIWEWVANNWLGSDNIIGYADTISDMTVNAVASLAGGALLILWAEAGWSTTRRITAAEHRRREAAAKARKKRHAEAARAG